jgi:MurNAc alpha-1-phosphate uridylyltransferase
MSFSPKIAMVFAAGLGTRMRHLTADKPKPMVEVCGKALIDYRLDKLKEFGIERVVVNTHYKADVLHQHLKPRTDIEIIISHETERLETGGGILKSIDLLGSEPIFVINSDVIWLDNSKDFAPALNRLAENFDINNMDFLLLMHNVNKAVGYYGDGDFNMKASNNAEILTRTEKINKQADDKLNVKHQFVYTGIQILNQKIVKEYAEKTGEKFFSLSKIFNLAMSENSDNLKKLYGIEHKGDWLHVDSPESLADAENFLNKNTKK